MRHIPSLRPPPARELDTWVSAVAAMLSQIKNTIISTHGLSYPYISLTVSDFEADTRNIFKDRFHIAAQDAGLELFQTVTLASRSALGFYGGMKFCHEHASETDTSCLTNEVLSVSYSEVSLGVTLLTRWTEHPPHMPGIFWPQRLSENLELGSESQLRRKDPETYWKAVKSAIEVAVGAGETVDQVIFLGSEAGSEDLRKLVGDVEREHRPEGKVELVRFETKDDDLGQSLFAVARGAAMIAREGMVSGFDVCIVPDYCERDEGDEEKWRNEQEL